MFCFRLWYNCTSFEVEALLDLMAAPVDNSSPLKLFRRLLPPTVPLRTDSLSELVKVVSEILLMILFEVSIVFVGWIWSRCWCWGNFIGFVSIELISFSTFFRKKPAIIFSWLSKITTTKNQWRFLPFFLGKEFEHFDSKLSFLLDTTNLRMKTFLRLFLVVMAAKLILW